MIKIFLPNKQKKFLGQTSNNNAPKELFYGILASNLIDFNKDCIDTRNFINSKFEKICDILINSSFSKKFISLTSQVRKNAKILSFTDWDSINFGYHKKLRNDLTLIGGFHGLFDFLYERTKNNIFFNKKNIQKSY